MRTARNVALLAAWLLVLAPPPAGSADQSPERFPVTRPSPRLLIVTDKTMGNNVAAVRTGRGLVVIDTGRSVEAGRAIRKIIERALPGEPFVYVVNTHSHWDHVLGNPAYPEATIVAHENARQAMMKVGEKPGAPSGREGPIAATRGLSSGGGAQVPPPPQVGQVGVAAEFLDDTLPDLTFTDRMTLFCGDLTLRLIYFGPAHTLSDILLLLPEEKTLFVGDLFFKARLPGFNEWLAPDVERWRAVLDEVLERGPCETVLPGHGAPIPWPDFEKQVRYALDLWDGLARARREGRTLADAKREFALAARYPDLAGWNVADSAGRTIHDENIRKIWKHLSAAPMPGGVPCTDGSKTI
jgi:glyoxylase-like metal-dependent hydrolase (beta-lactamase superfamily II)